MAYSIGDEVDFTDGAGVTHRGTILERNEVKGTVTIVESKNGHRWTHFPVAWVNVPVQESFAA